MTNVVSAEPALVPPLEHMRLAAVSAYRRGMLLSIAAGLVLGVVLTPLSGVGLVVGPAVAVLGWLWARRGLSRFSGEAKTALAQAAIGGRKLRYEALPQAVPASFAPMMRLGMVAGAGQGGAYRFEDLFAGEGLELYEARPRTDEDGRGHGGFEGLALHVATPGGPALLESEDAAARLGPAPAAPAGAAPVANLSSLSGHAGPDLPLAPLAQALSHLREVLGRKPLRAIWTDQGLFVAVIGVDRFEMGSPFAPLDPAQLERASGRDLDAVLAVAAAAKALS